MKVEDCVGQCPGRCCGLPPAASSSGPSGRVRIRLPASVSKEPNGQTSTHPRRIRLGNKQYSVAFGSREHIQFTEDFQMGRGILLWLLGIPLPIVILLVLFMR
jgi:hypothetical protein